MSMEEDKELEAKLLKLDENGGNLPGLTIAARRTEF